MAWETPGIASTQESPLDQLLVQASQRTFMAKVYRWMFLGLALTGGVALYTAQSETLLQTVLRAFFPLLIVELLAVLGLTWLAPRLGGTVAALLFLGYAALNGLTFAVFFLLYELGSIAEVFFITAGSFAALSAYATFTRKDLSGWATFLYMGLFGVLIAGVVNLFVQSDGVRFVTACAGVVVFAGLTAYDTQKLRALHQEGNREGSALPVTGALILYLDFVNLFIKLLQLFGRRR